MRGRLRTPPFRLLAGYVSLALALAVLVHLERVTLHTPGAVPNHYRFHPGPPRLISANSVAHDLACTETIVAVADIARGLSLYEYGFWRSPLSTVKPEAVPGYWRVVVQGHLAYALTIRGFDVIDITQPAKPSILGSYLTGTVNRANPLGDESTEEDSRLLGGQHLRFDVKGNRAYVTDDESDLHIVDITDPHRPTQIGLLDFGDPRGGVRLTGVAAGPDSLVYVAVYGISGYRGIEVVDVAIPTRPRKLSYTQTGHNPRIVSNGRMLCVVTSHIEPLRNILTIFRAGPALTKVSERTLYRRSSELMKICGTRVLVPFGSPPDNGFFFSLDRGYSGVEIVDIADPARPRSAGRFSTPGLAQAAITTKGMTLIAGGVAGLLVRH